MAWSNEPKCAPARGRSQVVPNKNKNKKGGKKKQVKVECDYCDGDGWLWVDVHCAKLAGTKSIRADCYKCYGKGYNWKTHH